MIAEGEQGVKQPDTPRTVRRMPLGQRWRTNHRVAGSIVGERGYGALFHLEERG